MRVCSAAMCLTGHNHKMLRSARFILLQIALLGRDESRRRMADLKTRRSLTLGLERIGELPIAHRRVSVVFILILTALAALGTLRLQADDSLSRLFQSDTEDFRLYQKVTETFPSNEFDVLCSGAASCFM